MSLRKSYTLHPDVNLVIPANTLQESTEMAVKKSISRHPGDASRKSAIRNRSVLSIFALYGCIGASQRRRVRIAWHGYGHGWLHQSRGAALVGYRLF